jgi:hypothetical protein
MQAGVIERLIDASPATGIMHLHGFRSKHGQMQRVSGSQPVNLAGKLTKFLQNSA